ncbi:MAG: hypothetical protein BroJett029_28280 [Alphaproteobacteria bacterium]|nr:MAG: hypothetical protein BroJett029_28280 [Alphaproteobacteria bacterium]
MGLAAPLIAAAVAAFALVTAAPAGAVSVEYVIRGAPDIQHPEAGKTEIIIDASGEKAAIGSNDLNGMTLGSITTLAITRYDDRTRFPAGSGPAVAPYLNIWITDGLGHYAVVANEPSNPDFQPLYSNGYNLSFADLSDKVAKIFETNDKSWLPKGGVGLTWADLATFVIQAPSVAQLTAGWGGLGTGAPRELGTNVAYGVNWVFGDTLSNYVSGDDGYIVGNVRFAATAVPEPATVALLGAGLVGLGLVRRRRGH